MAENRFTVAQMGVGFDKMDPIFIVLQKSKYKLVSN